MRYACLCLILSLLLLVNCSGAGGGAAPATTSVIGAGKTYAAGEKAVVGKLTYTIVDTQIVPRLGDDAASARTPKNRFYMLQISVSNGGNQDSAIPSMTLVADNGALYPEMADGTGVRNWLGVVRKVAANGTEEGVVAFDAPAAHYKLKLTDEFGENEVYSDIPLNPVNMHSSDTPVPQGLIPDAGEPEPAKK